MAKIVIDDLSGEMFENAVKIRTAFDQADANFTELYAGHVHQVSIALHATKTLYNLLIAKFALAVVSMDYTPDIAQGGALTATLVKAAAGATPASGTTPLHIAAAINLNGTAHIIQAITPTLTVADLAIPAGGKIGLVLSGAMTVGSGLLTIRYTRT